MDMIKLKQIGDGVRVMSVDAIVAKVVRVDEVDYELYNAARGRDNRGMVRVADAHGGEPAMMQMYATYDEAEAAYDKSIAILEA